MYCPNCRATEEELDMDWDGLHEQWLLICMQCGKTLFKDSSKEHIIKVVNKLLKLNELGINKHI